MAAFFDDVVRISDWAGGDESDGAPVVILPRPGAPDKTITELRARS